MKRAVGVGAVASALGLAFGVWAGFRFPHSTASGVSPIETGIALVLAANLLLGLFVWYRARPGSGDAVMMPPIVLSSASILVGILPHLLWPAAENLHIAGFTASAVATTILLVVQIRRYRRRTAHGV